MPLPPERTASGLSVQRYEWACQRISHDLVADVGCGCGHGYAILRKYLPSGQVIGFDISDGRTHGQEYPLILCNCEVNTFGGFGCVVCLETIEHFIDPYSWIKRLDVPEIVISTPTTPSTHLNPWHKHDISEAVLREMIVPKWSIQDVMKQKTPEAEYTTIHATRP